MSEENAGQQLWTVVQESNQLNNDGKLIAFLKENSSNEEILYNKMNDCNILLYAVLNGKYAVVDTLIQLFGRKCFGFSIKNLFSILDRQREEKKKEEERKRKLAAGEEVEEASVDVMKVLSEEFAINVDVIKQIEECGIYEGKFNESYQKHGTGITLYVNGDVYCGEYENHMKHGKGLYYSHQSKYYYCGDWQFDKRNGKGREVFEDKTKFVGYFNADEKSGKGLVIYANGDQYCGHIEKSQKQGRGTYEFAIGKAKYTGDWRSGEMHNGEIILIQNKVGIQVAWSNKKYQFY